MLLVVATCLPVNHRHPWVKGSAQSSSCRNQPPCEILPGYFRSLSISQSPDQETETVPGALSRNRLNSGKWNGKVRNLSSIFLTLTVTIYREDGTTPSWKGVQSPVTRERDSRMHPHFWHPSPFRDVIKPPVGGALLKEVCHWGMLWELTVTPTSCFLLGFLEWMKTPLVSFMLHRPVATPPQPLLGSKVNTFALTRLGSEWYSITAMKSDKSRMSPSLRLAVGEKLAGLEGPGFCLFFSWTSPVWVHSWMPHC